MKITALDGTATTWDELTGGKVALVVNVASRCGLTPQYTALEKLHLYSRQIPIEANPAYNSMFIVEPLNALGNVGNLFATHPSLEQRLMNLIGRETTGMYRHAA